MEAYLVLGVEALRSVHICSAVEVRFFSLTITAFSEMSLPQPLFKVGLLRGEVRTMKGKTLLDYFSAIVES